MTNEKDNGNLSDPARKWQIDETLEPSDHDFCPTDHDQSDTDTRPTTSREEQVEGILKKLLGTVQKGKRLIDDLKGTQGLTEKMHNADAVDTELSPGAWTGPDGVEDPGWTATTHHDGYSQLLVAHHDRGGTITEQYRTLRTNLLGRSSDERFCHVITSPQPGEGKTLTCLNLALVLAERTDYHTIVVDCNLHDSTTAELLTARAHPGLADVLQEVASLADVIQPTAYPNVSFIPAGGANGVHAGELLGRSKLKEIAHELRRQYDYILFDTPPINTTSDAAVVGRAVGEALLVVRMNKTHRDAVDRAIRLLRAANVKTVGMVLTHHRQRIPDFFYQCT